MTAQILTSLGAMVLVVWLADIFADRHAILAHLRHHVARKLADRARGGVSETIHNGASSRD